MRRWCWWDCEIVYGGFRKLVCGDFEMCDFRISRIEISSFENLRYRESRYRDFGFSLTANRDFEVRGFRIPRIEISRFRVFDNRESRNRDLGFSQMTYRAASNPSLPGEGEARRGEATRRKTRHVPTETWNSVWSVSYTHLTLPTTPYV